eukprot:3757766-Amphidinium_carterae.1
MCRKTPPPRPLALQSLRIGGQYPASMHIDGSGWNALKSFTAFPVKTLACSRPRCFCIDEWPTNEAFMKYSVGARSRLAVAKDTHHHYIVQRDS